MGGSQAVKARDFDSLIVGSIPARSASREGQHANTLSSNRDKPPKSFRSTRNSRGRGARQICSRSPTGRDNGTRTLLWVQVPPRTPISPKAKGSVHKRRDTTDYRKHSTPLTQVSHAVRKACPLVGATKLTWV